MELAFDGYKLRGVVTSDVNGTPVKQMTMEPLMGESRGIPVSYFINHGVPMGPLAIFI